MIQAPPYAVPREAIETYVREGATCVPGAFADWVDRLLAAYDRVAAQCDALMASGSGGRIATLKNGSRSIFLDNPPGFPPLRRTRNPNGESSLRHVVWHDPDFAAWLTDSPAASIVAQVIGSTGVRFWWDQFFNKAGDNPAAATTWHHDIGSFSFYGMQLPSLWIALTDVDIDNAPLMTVVGSHLRTEVMYRPVTGAENVPLCEGYAELSDLHAIVEHKDTQIRTWTVRAGDALVIHPYTFHASLPRQGHAGRRVAYTSRWLGDDVVWRKRPMTFDYPDDPRCHGVVQDRPPPDSTFPVFRVAA